MSFIKGGATPTHLAEPAARAFLELLVTSFGRAFGARTVFVNVETNDCALMASVR
jgi:hypothetical protein